jgi:hypothetical protein
VLDEHAMSADPGINHRDVDSTDECFGAFDAFERLVAYCYIANEHVSFGASGSHAIRYVVQRVLATRHENDSRTIASGALRERAADAGRRSRDQDGATAQGA